MMQEITGTLVCHRFQNPRRGRNGTTLGHLVRDLVDPLPSSELWVITDASKKDSTGRRPFFYKTKSGRKPEALAAVEEGATVTVRASVEPWDNKLGAFISRLTYSEVAKRKDAHNERT